MNDAISITINNTTALPQQAPASAENEPWFDELLKTTTLSEQKNYPCSDEIFSSLDDDDATDLTLDDDVGRQREDKKDKDCACALDDKDDQERDPHAGIDAFEETPRELGARGERCAARYLQRFGYEILERNWRCRFGEADIIALSKDGVLCFVEVKTRRSVEEGIPEEAVTQAKQQRYERIALSYLMLHNVGDDCELRFDIIAICVVGSNHALLRHHKACFDGRC